MPTSLRSDSASQQLANAILSSPLAAKAKDQLGFNLELSYGIGEGKDSLCFQALKILKDSNILLLTFNYQEYPSLDLKTFSSTRTFLLNDGDSESSSEGSNSLDSFEEALEVARNLGSNL